MSTQVQFPNLGISVNVNPVAFRLGNFEVYWYGILIGIGFMLAVLYGFSSCKKMNINKDHLFDTIIGGLIGGVACFLIVYFVLVYWLKPQKYKIRLYQVISIIPCCILIGHAFGRVGCFFAGCCHGIQTDSIFGVRFPEGPPYPVHPTQLYEADPCRFLSYALQGRLE